MVSWEDEELDEYDDDEEEEEDPEQNQLPLPPPPQQQQQGFVKVLSRRDKQALKRKQNGSGQ